MTLIAITQIVLQIFTAALAWRVFQPTLSRWYYALPVVALSIMALRRITAFTLEFEEGTIVSTLDKVILPFTITVLLFLGFYLIDKSKHENQ